MSLNLRPLLSELTIKTKQLKYKKLNLTTGDEFAWAQNQLVDEVERQYNAGLPVRIIVLKARQLGISTVTEGILFWWTFIHKGVNGLILAYRSDTAEDIFNMTKTYWDTWPFKDHYTQKYATRKQLQWVETGSALRVATAGSRGGRGSTFHAIHATECAFYQDPRGLMGGLEQTLPHEHGTIEVLESTANGVGNWWHERWQAAEAGDNDYVPLFFPWFKHYEYRRKTTLCIPQELTADERHIISLGADYENIEWYRWALGNRADGDEAMLLQEYPSTPEDAFIATGRPVFSPQFLKECYEPAKGYRGTLIRNDNGKVKWQADEAGGLTIFRAPARDGREDRYMVSGDPSMTVDGDPACVQVFSRETMEQVAVWHGRIDPSSFAEVMMRIGEYYNNAMLCPEVEGGGYGTIALILDRGYPNVWQHRWHDRAPGKAAMNYGWSTNGNRKLQAVGRVQKLIYEHAITIHDRKTYSQMFNYTFLDNGEMSNANDEDHDDAVMALCINAMACFYEGPFMIGGGGQAGVIPFDVYQDVG
jgi:hypothetical protein